MSCNYYGILNIVEEETDSFIEAEPKDEPC